MMLNLLPFEVVNTVARQEGWTLNQYFVFCVGSIFFNAVPFVRGTLDLCGSRTTDDVMLLPGGTTFVSHIDEAKSFYLEVTETDTTFPHSHTTLVFESRIVEPRFGKKSVLTIRCVRNYSEEWPLDKVFEAIPTSVPIPWEENGVKLFPSPDVAARVPTGFRLSKAFQAQGAIDGFFVEQKPQILFGAAVMGGIIDSDYTGEVFSSLISFPCCDYTCPQFSPLFVVRKSLLKISPERAPKRRCNALGVRSPPLIVSPEVVPSQSWLYDFIQGCTYFLGAGSKYAAGWDLASEWFRESKSSQATLTLPLPRPDDKSVTLTVDVHPKSFFSGLIPHVIPKSFKDESHVSFFLPLDFSKNVDSTENLCQVVVSPDFFRVDIRRKPLWFMFEGNIAAGKSTCIASLRRFLGDAVKFFPETSLKLTPCDLKFFSEEEKTTMMPFLNKLDSNNQGLFDQLKWMYASPLERKSSFQNMVLFNMASDVIEAYDNLSLGGTPFLTYIQDRGVWSPIDMFCNTGPRSSIDLGTRCHLRHETERLFDKIKSFATPIFIIFDTPPKICMDRLISRDRPAERNISLENFLEELGETIKNLGIHETAGMTVPAGGGKLFALINVLGAMESFYFTNPSEERKLTVMEDSCRPSSLLFSEKKEYFDFLSRHTTF